MTNTCCIASYGYGHLAGHCIDTVISQSVRFDAVIFADDGAGDCGHLPSIYPEINYVFRKNNLGTIRNFQDLLYSVETDRVMFLGADNWLRQDALEALSCSEADIVTYDIQATGEFATPRLAGSKREGGYHWDMAKSHHGSMIYSVDIAKTCGGYMSAEVPGRTIEDMDLYRWMIEYGAEREHIAEPLLYYRRHRKNFNKLS